MNRRFLFVIILIFLVFTVTACNGKDEANPATAGTQEAAQVSELVAAQPDNTAPAAQASDPGQNETAPTSASEPTQAPADEQTAPTPAPTSTSETSQDTSTSSSQPTQAAANPETPDCVNKAAFYEDVTIPDDTVVRQGDKFLKTWRVRNEGDCTWKDYTLVYAGGEAMNAAPSNPVPEAAPGSIIDISVNMEAPGRGGTHLSYWQFSSSTGKTFGVGSGANGMLWARIKVDYISGEPATLGSNSPSTAGSTGTTTNVSTGGSNNSSGNNSSGNNSSGNNSSGNNSSGNNSSGNNSSGTTNSGCNYKLNSGYENQILQLINKARADNGVEAVTRDSMLDAAALAHSMDMACNNFISHTGSDGSLWYQRVSAQGFANSNSARENIYTGSPDFGGDAKGAFTWWMGSQIHRDNILFSSVSVIGISYVFSENATYGGLYTLVLARP